MKADDRIIARANKLATVQKHIYESIESLQDFLLQYATKSKTGWIYKKEIYKDQSLILEIAISVSMLEELQKIESLCTK